MTMVVMTICGRMCQVDECLKECRREFVGNCMLFPLTHTTRTHPLASAPPPLKVLGVNPCAHGPFVILRVQYYVLLLHMG